MSDDIKIEVIKKTQETLGKFVKKPPLTEKLLRKPPFRFLHDIIKVLIKDYKFFDGIFTDAELKSENVTGKDEKIKFLYKIINTMNLLTNTEIGVRPSKIVAGLDPTKTNELLQAIGKALAKNLNTNEILQQINESNLDLTKDMKVKAKKTSSDDTKDKVEKPRKVRDLTPSKKHEKTVKKIEINRTTPRQSKEKLKKQKESVEKLEKVEMGKFHLKNSDSLKGSQTRVNIPSKNLVEKRVKKEDSKESVESSPQSEHKVNESDDTKKSIVEKVAVSNVENIKNIEKATENIETIEKSLENNEHLENLRETNQNIEQLVESNNVMEDKMSKQDKKLEQSVENVTDGKSIEKQEKIHTEKEVNEQDVKVNEQEKLIHPTKEIKPVNEAQSNPPPSARPRTSLRPPSARPISARPAAPRVRDRHDIILPPEKVVPLGKVNVIVENVDKDTRGDENENLVIVETSSNIPEITLPLKINVENQPQGHLVAQILETQKELLDETSKVPFEIEWEEDGQRNKERKKQYIENIRAKIQTITRAALPLGQIVNFLQEDYDNITRELKMWRSENDKHNDEIAQQKLIADGHLEPLLKQYHEMEEEIQKQKQRNNALKSETYQNQQKIDQLLNTLI